MKTYYRYRCPKCGMPFKAPEDPECLTGEWVPERLRVMDRPDPQRKWTCSACNTLSTDEEVREFRLIRYGKNEETHWRGKNIRPLVRSLGIAPDALYDLEELVAFVAKYCRPQDVFEEKELREWARNFLDDGGTL